MACPLWYIKSNSPFVKRCPLALRLFFAALAQPLETMAFRDVERFLAHQHQQGLAPTTVNRRRHALKHFFDFLVERRLGAGHPSKPSHFARLGRPLPRGLSTAQRQALFAQSRHPMETALCLVLLRCGRRVAAVARRKEVNRVVLSPITKILYGGVLRKSNLGTT